MYKKLKGVRKLSMLLVFSALFTLLSVSHKPTVCYAATYVHPGMLHTQADLDRMKTQVAGNAHPWIDDFKLLQDNSLASSSYTLTTYSIVYRNDATYGDTGNQSLSDSANVAYYNALEWYITGNTAYATEAISILNGWSNTLTSIQGHDAILAASIYGYKLLNAAEIIRYTNAGWASADITKFSTMMANVFYPLTGNFGKIIDSTKTLGYYWANGNWDAACILFNMCYGVWIDDDYKVNKAVTYYQSGAGNGSIPHYIQTIDGQCQESGRDQAHVQLGLGYLADAAEVGYNQKSVNSGAGSMYSYNSNALLKGIEYTASYNLGNTVSWTTGLTDVNGYTTYSSGISAVSRFQFRPIYEQAYNLYHNLAGLSDSSMPYTKQIINRVKVERWNSDHPSYGSLLNAQDTRTGSLSPKITLLPAATLTTVITAPSSGASALANTGSLSSITTSEQFTMDYLASKSYDLKSVVNSKYVTAPNSGAGALIASSTSVGTAEKFNMIDLGNGAVKILAAADSKYIGVSTTDNLLYANVGSVSTDYQRFYILYQP